MKKSIILFFTIISITTFSQVEDYKSLDYINYSRKREYTIEEIKISGLKYLNPDVLVNLSGLKIGNKITIPGDDISKAIDNYWKHGLFSDVKIVANKIEGDKIFLEIYLQEQPRVSKLVIEDINKNEREDIEEKIELKRNSQINDNVINTTTTIIKNHFIEKGFLNTDVNF